MITDIVIRQATVEDAEDIYGYFRQLSNSSKHFFMPHAHEIQAIENILISDQHLAYIALIDDAIVAYFVLKKGFIEHDAPRFMNYEIQLDAVRDCAIAPSVTDKWQGKGIANIVMQFIVNDLLKIGVRRMILWGGVSKNNTQALKFYQRQGFSILGRFMHNGENFDMCKIF